MSFWNSFTHGFAHGAFGSMFGGWGMGCCGWGMPCCNQAPLFFTPSLFMGGFSRYVQPMVNVPQLPMPSFMPMNLSFSGNMFDFSDVKVPNFSDINFGSTNTVFGNSTFPDYSYMGDSFMSVSSPNKKTSSATKSETKPKTKTSDSGGKKSNVKVQHWSKMSDDELKSVYGNYARSITTKYNGTAEDINKYLKGKGVLEGQGQAFIDAQNKYGISASVLVGITMFETGKGKSSIAKTHNNVGGVRISGSKDWKRFDSVSDCIMEMARFLKAGYAENSGRPLTKLYQVNGKYCPASDTGQNANWAKNVDAYASELEHTARA